ncbi:MAG: MmpS family transport accessory protein, partial [Mycobacterium sp.]
MAQRSVGRHVLARAWLPLVIVVALAVGALCMWKVHQSSAPGPVRAVSPPQAPEEFTPKRLTYELFGDVGSGGMLDYIDIDGHPHEVQIADLPWSHTETTTL